MNELRKFTIIIVFMMSFLVQLVMAQDDELQLGFAMTIAGVSLSEEPARSAQVASIETGELVTILEINAPWVLIEYGEIKGWVVAPAVINVSGPIPLPRSFPQMTYDIESDRIILFGGLLRPHPAEIQSNDTWAYEIATNTWTEMSPTNPPPLGEGPLAYDAESDRAILFLGTINQPPDRVPNETWAYDYNTNTWENMEPQSSPPRYLRGSRMVYDTESDRMILYGGLNAVQSDIIAGEYVFVRETWAYDYNSNTWTQMNPASSPPDLLYHAMSYDAQADRVILLAYAEDNMTSVTWLYDYNTDTWETQTYPEGPEYRINVSMVYAENINKLVFFGGGTSHSTYNDTWAYDFASNTWTELKTDVVPVGRAAHALVYSSAAEKIVLYGGRELNSSGLTNVLPLEIWLYDPAENTWTYVAP